MEAVMEPSEHVSFPNSFWSPKYVSLKNPFGVISNSPFLVSEGGMEGVFFAEAVEGGRLFVGFEEAEAFAEGFMKGGGCRAFGV